MKAVIRVSEGLRREPHAASTRGGTLRETQIRACKEGGDDRGRYDIPIGPHTCNC